MNSVIQKLMPCRSRAGIIRYIGSEGSTYQNVAPAWAAVFSASGLSFQSRIIPRTDTSGSDATNAPKPGQRRARVDAIATNTPEISDFQTRNSVV